jgi:hypothetical protein
MADVFTKKSKQGWGSRLGSSLSGMLIGVLLFFGSFGVIFWNEGKVDLSKIADDAVSISSETVEQNEDLQGELVSVSGILSTDETLGDGLYLREDNYLAVKRIVEVYAWTEKTSTTSETKLGGSVESETTYSYETEWTRNPADSSTFEFPADHQNPSEKPLEDVDRTASSGNIGAYVVDVANMQLPAYQQVSLDGSNTQFSIDSTAELASSQYIFNGFGTLSDPEIGDVRISYEVVPSGNNVTVFGALNGNKIETFRDKDNNTVYRAFASDASSAVATLHGEYKTSLWIFRVVGFLMMWIGLGMILGPLSVFLDVVPFLGNVSRSVVGIATFLVSAVLTIVAIIISKIFHSWIALLVLAIVGAAAVYWYLNQKGKKEARPTQEA